MTEKYRQMILFFMLIIVVIVIIDLVFNFRGIFMENYTRYIKSQEKHFIKETFSTASENYNEQNPNPPIPSSIPENQNLKNYPQLFVFQ